MSELRNREGFESLQSNKETNTIPSEIQKIEGFEEFKNFLLTQPKLQQQKIESIFKTSEKTKGLVEELSITGFPVDSEGLEDLIGNFGRDIKGQIEETISATYNVEKQGEIGQVEVGTNVVEVGTNVVEVGTNVVNENNIDNEKKKNIDKFLEDIKTLKGFDVDFNNFLENLEKEWNNEKLTPNDFNTNVSNYLKQGDNLSRVLTSAQKNFGDNNVVLKYVQGLSKLDPELAQKLNKWNETVQKESIREGQASVIRQIQTREFFGNNLEGIKSTGTGYSLGDKEVDFSTHPPSAYIKGERGYKLETELPQIPKEFNEKRREWQKRRDTLKKDFEREKTSFDLKESELKDFAKDFPEPRESWAEEKFQSMKKDLTIIEQNLSTIHEQITALNTEMRQVLSQIEFGDREERQLKENEKRKTLRFLSSIGFDILPQSITDSVIAQLNANSSLRARLGFNGVIDLANGQLGFNSDNDVTQNTPKEKADFAKVFNRMIGGKDSSLIDASAILNGTGNPVKDSSKLSLYLEQNGYKNSGIAVGKMIENLSKSGVEGNKKEK